MGVAADESRVVHAKKEGGGGRAGLFCALFGYVEMGISGAKDSE